MTETRIATRHDRKPSTSAALNERRNARLVKRLQRSHAERQLSISLRKGEPVRKGF